MCSISGTGFRNVVYVTYRTICRCGCTRTVYFDSWFFFFFFRGKGPEEKPITRTMNVVVSVLMNTLKLTLDLATPSVSYRYQNHSSDRFFHLKPHSLKSPSKDCNDVELVSSYLYQDLNRRHYRRKINPLTERLSHRKIWDLVPFLLSNGSPDRETTPKSSIKSLKPDLKQRSPKSH